MRPRNIGRRCKLGELRHCWWHIRRPTSRSGTHPGGWEGRGGVGERGGREGKKERGEVTFYNMQHKEKFATLKAELRYHETEYESAHRKHVEARESFDKDVKELYTVRWKGGGGG